VEWRGLNRRICSQSVGSPRKQLPFSPSWTKIDSWMPREIQGNVSADGRNRRLCGWIAGFAPKMCSRPQKAFGLPAPAEGPWPCRCAWPSGRSATKPTTFLVSGFFVVFCFSGVLRTPASDTSPVCEHLRGTHTKGFDIRKKPTGNSAQRLNGPTTESPKTATPPRASGLVRWKSM